MNPYIPPFGPTPWNVPIALGLWAVSVFLLLQSVAFLRWVTKADDDAPNPRAGVNLAWIVAGLILIFFYIPWFFNRYAKPDTFALFAGLLAFPLRGPESFSQALLLSSLPIGALAAFKFMIAASLARSPTARASALTRSPITILAAGLFTLLQIAGSVASLLSLFR